MLQLSNREFNPCTTLVQTERPRQFLPHQSKSSLFWFTLLCARQGNSWLAKQPAAAGAAEAASASKQVTFILSLQRDCCCTKKVRTDAKDMEAAGGTEENQAGTRRNEPACGIIQKKKVHSYCNAALLC
jgi:hypothetical protein